MCKITVICHLSRSGKKIVLLIIDSDVTLINMDIAREAKLKLAEERKRLAERASAQSKVTYLRVTYQHE